MPTLQSMEVLHQTAAVASVSNLFQTSKCARFLFGLVRGWQRCCRPQVHYQDWTEERGEGGREGGRERKGGERIGETDVHRHFLSSTIPQYFI